MRIHRTSTGCWIFTGPLDQDGYGKIKLKSQTFAAHRLVAHVFLKALMSPQEVVAHRCDTPACINPEHLFITTSKGNTLDRDAKGRGVVGASHPNAKLSKGDVLAMRKRYAAGESMSAVAARYPHVTLGCVANVLRRLTWKHV